VRYFSNFSNCLDQVTADRLLRTGIADLLPIPRLLPPFQGYPSQAIVFDGVNMIAPRLYSLATKASPTGLSNGSAAQTSNVNHCRPKPNTINRYRLPTPKRGFDVTELPVEIICEIFEKFIEDDSHPHDEDPPRPRISKSCRSDPTILGQICSRWRTVAIDLPILWSNIYIYNPKRSQVRLVGLWLERSGNKSLCLTFDYNRLDGVCDLKAASKILTYFISHLEYWRIIDFLMPLQLLDTFLPIVHIPKTPVLLESCTLVFNSSSRHPYKQHFGPYIDAIWKFIHTSPNLHRVNWASTGVDKFPKHAPFHQLTHVETYFQLSIDDALTFLAAVPLIEELSLSTITLPSKIAPDPRGPPLFLQQLRVLEVYSWSTRTCPLFSSLMCPSLQILGLNHNSITDDQPNRNLSELIRFLQRSTCHLHTLELTNPYLSDVDLELHLQSPTLRSLTCLWVSTEIVSDKIVHLLMKKSEDGSHQLLPRLEKLLLDRCDTTDGLLSTMISSRWYVDETSPGLLRWAMVTPKRTFGCIDNHFLNTHVLY